MFGGKPDKDRIARLADQLDRLTAKSSLAEAQEDGDVICLGCAQRCRIAPGQRGVCRMRSNRPDKKGKPALWVPWGYVSGLAVDPIEKKPLFHVLPGREALSFGMLGCNLKCSFCQNWITSQVLRDAAASGALQEIEPEDIVAFALERGAPVIASTYNEPLITAEWAAEIMRQGKEKGLRGAFVSNGFASPEVLEYLRPVLDVYKVDLKTFQDENYRQLGGRLQPVLDTIRRAHEMGYWVEVVTLVIPGFNNSEGELRDMAQFIAAVSLDIPWHVTAFHPDYHKTEGERPTAPHDIARAAQAGADAGLKFVYSGNLRGALADLENTSCPRCGATLIQRAGYAISLMRLGPSGQCPECKERIPGIWA